MAASKPAPEGTYADTWSTLDFGDYGLYYFKILIEEMKEISEGHFIFELESVNEPRSFRARILSPDAVDYYGLTSEGFFCQKIGGAETHGCCNHEGGDFSNRSWSDEIPIDRDDHWAKIEGDYGLLAFQFVIKSTEGFPPLDPCDPYEAGGTSIPGPVVKKHSYYYPIPEGDQGKKQLRKKKVKVIWKKDM